MVLERAHRPRGVKLVPHEPPLHWLVVVGAAPSAATVNPVELDVRPAALVAETVFGPEGCAAPGPKL